MPVTLTGPGITRSQAVATPRDVLEWPLGQAGRSEKTHLIVLGKRRMLTEQSICLLPIPDFRCSVTSRRKLLPTGCIAHLPGTVDQSELFLPEVAFVSVRRKI